MNKTILILTSIIICTISISVSAQHKIKWNNGFNVNSEDNQFKLKFGGRIMYDVANIQEADGSRNVLSEFRRVRFFSSGTIYSNVSYKINIDFASRIAFKDVFIELNEIPIVGNLRVGHFKEPFRLDALTSSKYMTFMERPNGISFTPERNSGIMVHKEYAGSKLGLQFGVFGHSDDLGNDLSLENGYDIVARIASKLDFGNNPEKIQYVHLGFGYNSRYEEGNDYSVSARPGVHLGPKFASVKIPEVNNINLINFEFALISGPFSAQGEFLNGGVNQMSGLNNNFHSYYGQLSYFLTGEARVYDDTYETFGRVKPYKNFGNGSIGAWEIAFRYQAINLEDDQFIGEKLTDYTVGLNWYLNPATRIMANYVIGSTTADEHFADFEMRFQLDF